MAACNGGGASSISDLKDADAVDSLMFYYGQRMSADYWLMAQGDSAMKTAEAREEYMRGFRAGMAAVKSDEAYNNGLMSGLQQALNIKGFEKEYGVKIKPEVLTAAMEAGLKNDSAVDNSVAAREFTRIMRDMDSRKEAADREASRQTLKQEAVARKMTKVNDDLYGANPKTQGNGELIKPGDRVSVVCDIDRVGGDNVDRLASPDVNVGSTMPGPLTEALLTMKRGETREFLTTAAALYGRMYQRRGLEANTMLLLTLTANPAQERPAADKADKTDKPENKTSK